MDGKQTDTTKHDHATGYWIKNTRIPHDSRNYNIYVSVDKIIIIIMMMMIIIRK